MFERLGRGVFVARRGIRRLLPLCLLALPLSNASAQTSLDGAIRGVAVDQAAAATAAFRRRTAAPIMPTPRIIDAQVAGSGTAPKEPLRPAVSVVARS